MRTCSRLQHLQAEEDALGITRIKDAESVSTRKAETEIHKAAGGRLSKKRKIDEISLEITVALQRFRLKIENHDEYSNASYIDLESSNREVQRAQMMKCILEHGYQRNDKSCRASSRMDDVLYSYSEEGATTTLLL